MTSLELHLLSLVLFVSVTLMLAIFIKAGFERIGVPGTVGYLLLMLKALLQRWPQVQEVQS